MANFKLAKKDAVSDTRSSVYDLHDKKLEYFDQEKQNLNTYILKLNTLKKKNDLDKNQSILLKIKELEQKIYDINNDTELNEYLLDFFSVINNSDSGKDENSTKKGLLDKPDRILVVLDLDKLTGVVNLSKLLNLPSDVGVDVTVSSSPSSTVFNLRNIGLRSCTSFTYC